MTAVRQLRVTCGTSMAGVGGSAAATGPAEHLDVVETTLPGSEECGVAIEAATFAAANDHRNVDIAAIMNAQNSITVSVGL